MKKWIIWGCIIGVLVLIVVTVAIGAGKTKPIAITVASVIKGDFTREVSGTGNIEAKEYILTFGRQGRVAKVAVVLGDHVVKGQLLAELTVEKENADISASQENLTASREAITAQDDKTRADRAKMQADLKDAKRNLEEGRRLLDVGDKSPQEVKDLERKVSDLERDLRSLDSQATSTRSNLTAQRDQSSANVVGTRQTLRESQVISPVDGYISVVDFRVGEMSTGNIKIVEDDTLRARVNIAESEVGLLREGMPARIELDSAPDHPLEATLTELGVAAVIKGEGGSASLPVKFDFTDKKDAALMAKSGYTITARVNAQQIPNITQVPIESLVEDSTGDNKKYSVWVMVPEPVKEPGPLQKFFGAGKKPTEPAPAPTATNPGPKLLGKVTKREVKVDARNLTKAAITGLAVGDIVVTLPPDTMRTDSLVSYSPLDDEVKK